MSLPTTELTKENLNRSFFEGGGFAWSITLCISLSLVGAAFLTPFVGESARSMLMGGFAPFCHQIPSRSFHLHGVQLALCHRCLGIYAAIPIALSAFMLLSPWKQLLSDKAKYIIPLSLVPLGLDWTLDFLGIWSNTPVSRLVTGSIFGLVAGYYLARGVIEITIPGRNMTEDESVKTSGANPPVTTHKI